MNTLSWLLYFADFVQGLGAFVTVLGILLTIVGAVAFFRFLYESDEVQPRKPVLTATQKVYSYSFIGAVLFACVAVFTPSRQTVLLIAASEMGEEVVTQPEVKEFFSLTFKKLRQQLEK